MTSSTGSSAACACSRIASSIDSVPVTLAWLTLPALSFALSIDRILNGLTRPLFGWISDHLGRENTMFVAFAFEAVGIYALSRFGHNPIAFVLLSGMVFLFWGEIFSLFPATVGDVFGTRQCRLWRKRHRPRRQML